MALKQGVSLGVFAVMAMVSCGGSSPTSPENRVLPAGEYSMVLEGCFGCPFNTTIGNHLIFRDGVQVRFRITNPTPSEATVQFLSATYLGSGSSVLDRWDTTTLRLEWTEVLVGGPGFVDRIGYSCNSTGCGGLATHGLRRVGNSVECEFAMFDPRTPGFGPGVCSVE